MRWQRFVNPVVIWLLRSPGSRLLSASTLAVTVAGRRSGATYTVPVNYVIDGPDALVISPRTHTWWKNLTEAAPVTIYFQGRRVRCVGRAFTDPATVAEGLLVFLRRSARYQRSLAVPLDTRRTPRRAEDLATAARQYALIRLTPIEQGSESPVREEARHGAGVYT